MKPQTTLLALGLTLFSATAWAGIEQAARTSYNRAYAAAAFPITAPLVTDGGNMTLVWTLSGSKLQDLVASAETAAANGTAPPDFQFGMDIAIVEEGSGSASVTCSPGNSTWSLQYNSNTASVFTAFNNLGGGLHGDNVTLARLQSASVPSSGSIDLVNDELTLTVTITTASGDMFASASYGADTPGPDVASGKCSNTKSDNLLFW
ncbi:MAG: hypothetical protein H6741_30735 [Alphaproteobacteria bacterium]|nr:hypothetical protein [Alphaproteobacteria bacterium]